VLGPGIGYWLGNITDGGRNDADGRYGTIVKSVCTVSLVFLRNMMGMCCEKKMMIG